MSFDKVTSLKNFLLNYPRVEVADRTKSTPFICEITIDFAFY